MQTIYADILFLINFTMDFLTLFVTASIMRRKVSVTRLCLSSAIGGIYGVAAVFMQGVLIINVFINLAVSYLMCLIAFNKRILPCYALFYGTGCLLGGAMTAFFTFMNGALNNVSTESSAPPGKIPLGWMALSAAVIGIVAIAGGRMTRRNRSVRSCLVSVVTHSGEHSFDGITDTGNLLTDPISGRPVIILRKKEMISVLPQALVPIFESEDPAKLTEADEKYYSSLRLIPSSSVGGDKLLLAYIPKKITLSGAEVSALIAMGNEESYGGHAALIPEILTN